MYVKMLNVYIFSKFIFLRFVKQGIHNLEKESGAFRRVCMSSVIL